MKLLTTIIIITFGLTLKVGLAQEKSSANAFSSKDTVNFILLTPRHTYDTIGHQLFKVDEDSTAMYSFYKRYSATTIAPTLSKNELFLNMPCGFRVILCVKWKKDDDTKIAIESVLQNHKLSSSLPVISTKEIAEKLLDVQKRKAAGKDKFLLFIDLSWELLKFYYEKPASGMDCCPDLDRQNALQAAFGKVCTVSAIRKGITIDTDTSSENPFDKFYSSPSAKLGYRQTNGRNDGDKVPDINPQRFVKIYERSGNKTQLVWENFEQYRKVLDSRSDILIDFKVEELREEIDFEGNISLVAELNNGDPIEVPPYSRIGQDYSTVGVSSMSPYDFSLSLLTILYRVWEIRGSDTFQKYHRAFHQLVPPEEIRDSDKLRAEIESYLNLRKKHVSVRDANSLTVSEVRYIDEVFRPLLLLNRQPDFFKQSTSPSGQDQLGLIRNWRDTLNLKDQLVRYLSSESGRFFNEYDKNQIGERLKNYLSANGNSAVYPELVKGNYTYDDILAVIAEVANKKVNKNVQFINLINTSYVDPLSHGISHLGEISQYLERFLRSDDDTQTALMSILQKDTLYLSQANQLITTTLADLRATLTAARSLKQEFVSAGDGDKAVTDVQYYKLLEIHQAFRNGMHAYFSVMKEIADLEEDQYNEASNYYVMKRNLPKRGNSAEFMGDWAEYLALKASRQIYKKLVTGVIELRKREITDDTKLTIYVLSYDASGKPKKYPVGSFMLRRTGWNERIADSFFLVQRVGSDTARYKGAAGVSFMWTYTAGDNADFFQKLQPSVGLNVSYLDFTNDESFEIGVGVVFGLWKNKVFFGWGRNLHAQEHSSYFSVGFSFTNLAQKLNEKGTSNQ